MTLQVIDGSQGEGGGQIVRTAVTLSALTGTAVRIEDIRAGRETPGLRPQHVTAILAAAEICRARTTGVEVGARGITFAPGGPVRAGQYEWSVGTAGAATLVLQTVLLPLALADGPSVVRVRGGTHVPKSPSGHYLRDVYAPLLLGLGVDAEIHLESYGWLPEGGGVLSAYLAGKTRPAACQMTRRGEIERIVGTAVGCNLPAHIPQRIANRAINLLSELGAPLDIRPQRARGLSTGAGLFLAIEYANGRGGFGVLGRKGMPSEVVAEQAVNALWGFHASGAALDAHLADQVVIPLALARGVSTVSVEAITPHLLTNIAVVRALLDCPITVDEQRRLVTFGAAQPAPPTAER